jgi:hypothetical protein
MDSSHRFFSTENIAVIIDLINNRYFDLNGAPLNFMADPTFVEQMIAVGTEYPHFFVTSDPAEGIAKLNDMMVRRALRALTPSDPAGQYYAGNVLFRDTRNPRSDDDGFTDVVRDASSVVLAGNVFQKRNAQFQKEQARLRTLHANAPYMNRFLRNTARPTQRDDFMDW